MVRRPGPLWAAWLGLAFVGCQSNQHRANVEKNLMNERASQQQRQAVVESYLIACPDVLQLHVEGRPEFSGRAVVEPDGCIPLGHYGKLRVEGLPLPGVARAVAGLLGVPPDRVQVRVAEFSSRHLVLVGEVVGRHRTIPYQGPETVLDVLQRVGGITPGAAPTEVYVVRSHLGDLGRPEVFHVDLQGIVIKQDHRTNVRVLPCDQIYVGETRQARIEKCIPPWVRPIYQSIWDMLPTGKQPEEAEHSFTHFIRGFFTRSEEQE